MKCGEEKTVLCAGLVCLDILNLCDHYPAEDTVGRCLDQWWARGGNANNDCTILSQFGVPCEIFGTLAGDHCVEFIKNDFEACGINYENCVNYHNASTPIGMAILNAKNGSRTIVHSTRDLPELQADDFMKLDLSKYKWIHFEARDIQQVIKMTKIVDNYNSTVSLPDRIKVSLELEKIKKDIELLFPCGDVIFVSKDLARHHGYNDMYQTVNGFAKLIRPGAIIISPWADKGACGRSPNGEIFSSPAFPPAQILDTLGAGDTFDASVIYALSNDKSIQDALTLACKTAGKKCGIMGMKNILPL